MLDFSTFVTLIKQAFPYLTQAQAEGLANFLANANAPGTNSTFLQLFINSMQQSAHVDGAGNIY